LFEWRAQMEAQARLIKYLSGPQRDDEEISKLLELHFASVDKFTED